MVPTKLEQAGSALKDGTGVLNNLHKLEKCLAKDRQNAKVRKINCASSG